MNKKELSEQDIITKFVLPALTPPAGGWDILQQVRQEYSLTADRITTKGHPGQTRIPDTAKRADIVLFYKPNVPLAVIEAKDNNHSVGAGMQQAIDYATLLDAPFAYSTNGDAFVECDRSDRAKTVERTIALDEFPSPAVLWNRLCRARGLTPDQERIVAQTWAHRPDKEPRHYQIQAVNRTIEAITKGQSRILLVMATGTGKTFTAFQIIHRLRAAKFKQRILFLADRNILVDQAKREFQSFGNAMSKIRHRKVDKAFEVYLALYQAVSGNEEERNIYRQFKPDFFDLIIVDECHRGSAADDSAWRDILDYFSSATQIGLTATPKETKTVSNIDYFGQPLFTYSLRQGIDEGFLAPYKVLRVELDKDVDGYTPGAGKIDKHGRAVEDRTYKRGEFDRSMVLEKRTELIAKRVTEYLHIIGRMSKTIVFCQDTEHADRMRLALVNENPDLYAQNERYIRKITGDDEIGRHEVEPFTNPREPYPVIATTAQLLSTGVDTKTVKLIVIDREIGSMGEFKQIIGRGTRVEEDYDKTWFTIMDFRDATRHFEDEDFDGKPEMIKEVKSGESITTEDGPNPGSSGTSTDPAPAIPAPAVSRSGQRRDKYVIADEDVLMLSENVIRYDSQGKRVDLPVNEHVQSVLRAEFPTRRVFLDAWRDMDRRSEVLLRLEREGISRGTLPAVYGAPYATFDLLAHLAYGSALISRKSRVDQERVQAFVTEQKPLARQVLDGLLARFAQEGWERLADAEQLKLPPFDKLGTVLELLHPFGGRAGFEKTIGELEFALYDDNV